LLHHVYLGLERSSFLEGISKFTYFELLIVSHTRRRDASHPLLLSTKSPQKEGCQVPFAPINKATLGCQEWIRASVGGENI